MGLSGNGGTEHRYQLCRDPGCPRSWCRIYREGYENGDYDGHRRGYAEGHVDGYSEGYRAGYDKGFPDGIASCPRPHAGG
jgi:hypothetical protein